MGSAVSGVAGAVGSVVGGISGAAGGIMGSATTPILGAGGQALGSSLGSLAQGIVSAIPDVPIANQAQVQGQIQGLNNLAGLNSGLSSNQLAASNQSLGNTQQAIGQSQGSINQAQNVNTGAGSNVNNAIGLVGQTAAGGGAAQQAASAQLQAGTDQAIRSQQAMANSGNLSQQISGQKTAMDNAAQLQQQNALNSSALQAQMAGTAQGQYTGAAAQQAGQSAQNAGLQQQQAVQQANLFGTQLGAAQGYANQAIGADQSALTGQTNALGIQQQALGQTGQNKAMAVGGVLNAAGAAGTAAALSDYNTKTDVQFASGPRAGLSLGVNGGNSQDEQSSSPSPGLSDDQKKSLISQMGNSFHLGGTTPQWNIIQSDKESKEDIDKNNKVSTFLDAIDPVSFKYKEPTGEMGKTPGEHIGVIAQQVEKAPGGKSMIVETPEGKGIDLASAVGTLLAAAAESHNRIKELEELFKSKMEKRKK